jgi:hypothetical protein
MPIDQGKLSWHKFSSKYKKVLCGIFNGEFCTPAAAAQRRSGAT